MNTNQPDADSVEMRPAIPAESITPTNIVPPSVTRYMMYGTTAYLASVQARQSLLDARGAFDADAALRLVVAGGKRTEVLEEVSQ